MTKNDSINIGVSDPVGFLQLDMACISHTLYFYNAKRKDKPMDTEVRVNCN